MKKLLLIGAIIMFGSHFTVAAETLTQASPSGAVKLVLQLDDQGRAFYSVSYKDKPVINASALGFLFKHQSALQSDFKISKVEHTKVDNTWEQPWGEQRLIRNYYRQLRVMLRETQGKKRSMGIVFRVYDNGIGFRYELQKIPGVNNVDIVDELTEFAFAGDYDAWWTPAQAGNQYEYLYRHTPLSKTPLIHTPATMKTDSGLYLSLHEAALHHYPTMNVSGYKSEDLHAQLVPLTPHTKVKAKIDLPFNTPWRTLEIAERPGDLITNYLTLNLNEPNKLGDVSWIHPGKYVGIWWELHLEKGTWKPGPKHGANTKNTKKYIDFAAKYGFDGVLVEGWNKGWSGKWYDHGGNDFDYTTAYPDYDVNALSQYAKEQGVYIIGHHETGASVDNYDSQLVDAYQFLDDHGMKAVKTGYVETDERLTNGYYHQGQYFVDHTQRVIDMAAQHHIMVDAHETVKDTGERRTYPNMMTREVARGQEYNAWSDDGGNPPNHTTILPFTRLLAGPMDFTPGIFELTLPTRPHNQVNTTLAKQLALYVVIYSPLQMAADLPENYEQHLDAFQFIRDVPVDWETTKVLTAQVGKYIAVARQERKGTDWYVGAITNENPRELTLALTFLSKGKRYKARIYRDAKDANYKTNPGAYTIDERIVTKGDVLDLKLAPGGGAAVSLKQL